MKPEMKKHWRRTDFLFVGLGVLPLVLMVGGLPELALLLFVPLLFVACFCGMSEQLDDAREGPAGLDPRVGGSGKPPTATGISLRNQLKK